jgi:hypothetical protein
VSLGVAGFPLPVGIVVLGIGVAGFFSENISQKELRVRLQINPPPNIWV